MMHIALVLSVVALLALSGTGVAVHVWTARQTQWGIHPSPPLTRVKFAPPFTYNRPGPVTTFNVNSTLSTPTSPGGTGSTGSTGGTAPVTNTSSGSTGGTGPGPVTGF